MEVVAQLTPDQAMARAIELAQKGLGFVAPNPPVGCVILNKSGAVIGEGYHQAVGQAHAEIEALNRVVDKAQLKGAHLIVTLEPCAHHGRTPPCAEALAQLPLAQVTYGLKDPNPLVSGRGLKILSDAGINVEKSVGFEHELAELVEVFFYNQQMQRPFVALKVASSLDGQIALNNGESQWITGEKSRQQAHYLRGVYDALLVGVQTLIHDNPKLNSRHENFASKENYVIIFDPEGRSAAFLSNSQVLQVRNPNKVIVFVGETHTFTSSARIISWPLVKGTFDLKEIFKFLWREGISSVMAEGGAHTASVMLQEHLVQRLYLFMAPKIIGSGGGKSWTTNLQIDKLAQAQELRHPRYESLGQDLLVTGLL